MRAPRRLIAFAAVAALVGAACGSDDDTSDSSADTTDATETTEGSETTEAPETTEGGGEEATTETTEYQPPARGDADLVIWADDTRAPVLEPIAASFSDAEGVNVQVLEVPFDEIRDNLSVQGPAGEGPDIIIGAHDWLGELVSNGVVEPLDLGPAAADYAEVAVQAFTYDGQVYGLPYAIENIALIRNTDLVPEAPATFEELEEIALGLLADGTVTVPLAVQQDPADPFHNYPLFSAMGGYVFGQDDDGSYNADDLGIDSEGGLAAAQKFADWSNSGLISKDVSYDVMIDSFSSGQAPFAITGPWAVGEFSDINFVVEPVPPVEGGTPNVFVGVQGFMVSSFSENVDLAKTFLLDYLNTEEVQLGLYDAGGRPPAMTSAFEQVASDPIIEGFGLAGQQGAPLPAIPEMSAVWENWTNAYNLVFTGTDPTEAFTDAATAIREAIAG
jgi:arabinogalactan oligomer / maltooligosaccharide transport system substrate-binding protein